MSLGEEYYIIKLIQDSKSQKEIEMYTVLICSGEIIIVKDYEENNPDKYGWGWNVYSGPFSTREEAQESEDEYIKLFVARRNAWQLENNT